MDQKPPALTAIAAMDRKELIALWKQVFSISLVFTGSREFLRYIIAQKDDGKFASLANLPQVSTQSKPKSIK